jgi:hypothetical protein
MTGLLMKGGLQNLSFSWLVLLGKFKTACHDGRNLQFMVCSSISSASELKIFCHEDVGSLTFMSFIKRSNFIE